MKMNKTYTITTLIIAACLASFSIQAAPRSTPVTVVNDAASPVPVAGTVDANVLGTPGVTIENSPSVEVVNEVPVSPPPLEPVQFSRFQQFDAAANLTHRFSINAGQTLLVEHISIACSPRTPMGAMVIGRTTVPGRTYAALWFTFEETGLVRFRDHSYATHAVTYYVHDGDELEFRILADTPGNGVCTIGAVGRYVNTLP